MLDGEITQLLAALRDGDRGALDRLFALVYDELRRRAHLQLDFRTPGDTLSTTALVHETYLRLAAAGPLAVEDRRHFFHLAARAMRQIAVDYARRTGAQKRGGGRAVPLLEAPDIGTAVRSPDLIALDEALTDLTGLDQRLGRLVELRFFAGLSVEEVAGVLGITDRTVKRDWRRARAFLYQQVTSGPGPKPPGPEPGPGVEGVT